ncbi:hypothetical protein L21SP5_00460 [Salinivirga cyanobacteriivorans]|uniref:Uncharacterized protein n=1 Tax=Salinivirga cyanobacteriivorans TaxID=1307839 RepID=A0A0S2HVP8_9BACT|nr:hypothetical protein L21SP5_00460 [Salinivirga cyanobacteriivorans]
MITNSLTVNFRCCLFLPFIFFSFNLLGQIELNNRYLDNYNDFFPHSIFSHFTHNDTIVFIYPDSISNTGLANELDEFVNQFSNHNIVLIGEEAIGNEFVKSNELIVFGNATINKWCNHFINDLPINDDILRGNSAISSWFNPKNPQRGCLIFSFPKGNTLPSLKGIGFGNQLAVKNDTSVIFQGFYNLRNNSLILSKKTDDKIKKNKKFKKVKDANLFLLPSCDDIKAKKLEKNEVERLIDNDINRNFDNIKDLEWLGSIARENEVICIGENHYFKSNINLRNRIFFYLNSIDSFPYILLEKPYSKTPIIEHFLTLSGNDSVSFYEKYISHVVHSQEEFELIKHIKRWNKTHKSKPLTLGCIDIEHQYKNLVNHVLLPLLLECTKDSIFFPDFQISNLQQLDSFIINAEKVINSTQIDHIGFLKRNDFENILSNLEATLLSYKAHNNSGFKGFSKIRNKKYIENILLFRRNNKNKKINKLCIFGGSNHYKKNTQDSLNIYYYLDKINLDTKNEVYSVRLLSLGYSFENLNLNSRHHKSMGRGYRRLIKKAKDYYELNNSKLNKFSIFPGITSILKDMMLLGCQLNGNPFKFDCIYWKKLVNKYNYNSRSDRLSSLGIYFDLCSFDKSIIIPYSQIINAIE